MLANVVTSTDFDSKPYQLQGLDDVGSAFSDFVTFNQNEILLQLLGQTLYDAFSVGVAALPAAWITAHAYVLNDQVYYVGKIYKALGNTNGDQPDVSPLKWAVQADNKWAQLLGGADYTIQNRKYHYAGVKAFMMPYIYAMWLDEQSTSVVATGGVVSALSENSGAVSPGVKIMQAYIEFKKLVINGCKDVALFVYWLTRRSNQGTLFGFIYANDALYFADVSVEGDASTIAYLMAHFKPLGSINDFDL